MQGAQTEPRRWQLGTRTATPQAGCWGEGGGGLAVSLVESVSIRKVGKPSTGPIK